MNAHWRFWTLWILVSGLWTIATLLRVHRVWAPQIGSWRILTGPWIWISLIVPPLVFAAMIAVIAKRCTFK